jgi:hypothetical protein
MKKQLKRNFEVQFLSDGETWRRPYWRRSYIQYADRVYTEASAKTRAAYQMQQNPGSKYRAKEVK